MGESVWLGQGPRRVGDVAGYGGTWRNWRAAWDRRANLGQYRYQPRSYGTSARLSQARGRAEQSAVVKEDLAANCRRGPGCDFGRALPCPGPRRWLNQSRQDSCKGVEPQVCDAKSVRERKERRSAFPHNWSGNLEANGRKDHSFVRVTWNLRHGDRDGQISAQQEIRCESRRRRSEERRVG